MKRSTLLRLWPMALLALALVLTACVRPAPDSEGAPVPTAIPGSNATPLATFPVATLPVISSPTPLTVISTPTPPPVTVAPTAAPGPTLPTQHTVQAGETLFSISALYGVPVADIQAANNIADPNNLTVGTVLTIPAPGTAPVATTPPTGGGETVHIVQAGENLFRIGMKYGFTAQELATYNGIPNVNVIYVGQQIKIPAR